MQVLVVDDDDSVRSVVVDMLRNWGYEAEGVEHGQSAIEYMEDEENRLPELILLDYKMPVMDGEQFLNLRQQREILRRIPVVVFTGSVDLVKIRSADGYVQKPFVRELLPYVEKFCSRHAA